MQWYLLVHTYLYVYARADNIYFYSNTTNTICLDHVLGGVFPRLLSVLACKLPVPNNDSISAN